MIEKEFKLIIDRAKQENDVQQHFQKHLDLLVDFVNYGSNLIVRVFDSSKKKLEDIVIVLVLLKQVVAMVDVVSILVSKGAVTQASLQARAAFEASIYIDWILKEETRKKAKYFYIANLRNQRLWALRFKSGTPEKELFSEEFKHLEEHLNLADFSDLEKRAEEEFTKIDNFLKKPDWIEMNNEFETKKNKRTGAEVYWYKLLGVQSIRSLARETGRLGEYDLFYSRSSEVTHTASYSDHVRYQEGTIIFEPIRQLKDIQFVLRFVTLVTMSTFIAILKHYRYGELDSFYRKYRTDWRAQFLVIPSVSYTPQTKRI